MGVIVVPSAGIVLVSVPAVGRNYTLVRGAVGEGSTA